MLPHIVLHSARTCSHRRAPLPICYILHLTTSRWYIYFHPSSVRAAANTRRNTTSRLLFKSLSRTEISALSKSCASKSVVLVVYSSLWQRTHLGRGRGLQESRTRRVLADTSPSHTDKQQPDTCLPSLITATSYTSSCYIQIYTAYFSSSQYIIRLYSSRTQNNTWQICKHLKGFPLQGTSTLDTTALQLQIALALVVQK